MKSIALALALCASAVAASPLQSRQSSNTAVLDVSVRQGTPNQLASGVLYGTPDTLDQIPDHFYTEPKLKYFRAGGAQLFDVGQRGWHWNEYEARFQSTLSNYRTARKYGGEFQLLPHDIWGTDTVNKSTVWPGDNGDWSDYSAFLDRLIADIKANDMLPGLKYDLWNEPNGDIFWDRPRSQWLDLWKFTYNKLRADAGLNSMPIIGPSLSVGPDPQNPWWTDYFSYIVANNAVPDQYTWHLLDYIDKETNDMRFSVKAMADFYTSTGAPSRPYCVNEYINWDNERINAANAWHIARLERYNTTGLRANWLSKLELHDFLAELVYRPDANSAYQPNGEWWLYRYYAQSMSGVRLQTEGTGDGVMDIFSTLGDDGVVRILTGVRVRTGTWNIEVRNLEALGFPSDGQITIQTYGFDDVGLRGASNGPSDRGTYTHTYTNGVLQFPVYQTDQDMKAAWAFEFKRP